MPQVIIASFAYIVGVFVLCAGVETSPTCSTIEGPTPGEFILQRGIVPDNDSATTVIFRGCRISEIQPRAFHGLPSLQHIDLSRNSIKNLKLGILNDVTRLTHLNLSYNFISDLEESLFNQSSRLEVLDLRGNKLEGMKVGLFSPLKRLKYLDLSDNDIVGARLSPAMFDSCKAISTIDFSRNDMSGAPSDLLRAMEVLDTLKLDGCFLKQVPEFATRSNTGTMKKLILSSNQMSTMKLTTFISLINLEELDLSSNEISELHEDVFKPLKNLKIIILRSNRLEKIPDKLFYNMLRLRKVDLSFNSLMLIPVNAFRFTTVEMLNISHNKFTYLVDNFCLELRNSGVKLKKFYFNSNPWQCPCLRDLLKEMKTYKISYNNAKYDGKNAVCVTGDIINTCLRQPDVNEHFNDLYYSN